MTIRILLFDKEPNLNSSETTQLAKKFTNVIKIICMNEGCSGIEKNRILEPGHPLCSSSSDVMPNIAAHTFSSGGTSNNSKTRNTREPVSLPLQQQRITLK